MGILKKILPVLLIGLLIGCATISKQEAHSDFTYESEISPAVFMEWEVVESEYFTDGVNKFAQYIMGNPEVGSPISTVVIVVIIRDDTSYQLISYGYNKHGVDYVYVLDPELNRYMLWMTRPSVGNMHNI